MTHTLLIWIIEKIFLHYVFGSLYPNLSHREVVLLILDRFHPDPLAVVDFGVRAVVRVDSVPADRLGPRGAPPTFMMACVGFIGLCVALIGLYVAFAVFCVTLVG